jgi:hypothetical protein
MRSSIIVAFAALGLITSASAQQVDQNTRQQIERIAAAYVENWNKHDAARGRAEGPERVEMRRS